jgi:hypothetical protein
VVAANGNIEPELAVGAHKRELVSIALVVEKLGEVGLVTFHIPNMDERDSLSEVSCRISESFNGIDRIKIAFAVWSFGVLGI